MQYAEIVFAACLLALPACLNAAEPVKVAADPDKVLNRIDEKVYGHFLEHIYHSVNGGLWGEMIWDRSFEGAGGSRWRIKQDCIAQTGRDTNVRLVFGDGKWKDYEFTLEARKTGGQEGFLILFRVKGDQEFYWCNFGGARNETFYLERGIKDGKRWRGVGKGFGGTIETGKWYSVRIRCEGPHLQVWLDGKQVIDFTDDANAHLAGKVGIGTWATQARFRNIKVASLDGKELFSGLPELPKGAAAANLWESYGPGTTQLVTDNPFNGESCQMVSSDGKETGVQQTPLCIRKDDACRGSLWARGEAPDGLVVRLLDGEKKLAEQLLPAPKDQWAEMPFEFKPDATAENATLQIGLRGQGKVWIDQVSMMADSSAKAGGYRPDLLKAIADLRPPIIRWPGGSFVSAYRWKDGIGPQSKRRAYPRVIWDDRDVNSYGTDEFVVMCRKIGAEPLIVINICHGDANQRPAYIAEACDWIEYCNGPATSKWGTVRAANGHAEPYNVKYWEIDNETWGMGAEAYAAAVCEFAPAMKKADPSIRLIACGSGGLSPAGRGQEWNQVVVQKAGKHFDYISTHHYEGPANFATGPAKAEAFFRDLQKIIAASENPRIKIDHSEWNAQSTDWRTGLYAGGLLNAFERCGEFFEIGGPALFMRHVSATRWDNAFINLDHRGWFPAPNYVVMKLWRDHFAPQRIACTGGEDVLNAVATKSADGKTLHYKAVNPTDQPVTLELTVAASFAVGKADMQVVAPGALDARNTLDKPDAVQAKPGEAKVNGQTVSFALPALSAAVLTIEKR